MYLKWAVSGDAVQVIESIPAAAVNCNIAGTAISEQFENRHILVVV